MLYQLLKPLLFSMDPEKAHHCALHIAKLSPLLGRLSGIHPQEDMTISVGSQRWNFPVGLAAGLDKNADALPFFSAQGFGAIECGTITLKPQEGNPRPRMFRYPEKESLRNAMGFPNDGLLSILPRLKVYESQAALGVNIGKNKDTSPEDSIEELSVLFESLKDHAGYFVINVSSPNTPGLRALQEKSYLTELFCELNRNRERKDLYLKIAPDLSAEKIIELTHLAEEQGLTAIIATNTSIMPERGLGGVSGKLLTKKAQALRSIILNEKTNLELIAVGGISHPEDMYQLWREGGKAFQVYTAYVYQGPELLKTFHLSLSTFVKRQNLSLMEFFKLPLEERTYRLRNYPA